MGHLSCQGFVEVAKRAVFEIQKSSHFAATCSHSSGRKWPQVAARASGRKWPQVAASGCLDGKYQPEWPHP